MVKLVANVVECVQLNSVKGISCFRSLRRPDTGPEYAKLLSELPAVRTFSAFTPSVSPGGSAEK